jgi:hypothetical protein
MDFPGDVTAFRKRFSRSLLLIAAGFFSAYLIPLVFCFLYLLRELFSFLRFAEFSIYYTVFLIELSSAIILMLPVIGGIWISCKMKGQHIPWRYTLPFIVVSCTIGVCDILQSYYSFSAIRDLPAALFIFQIMVLLILPATGWYLLKGLQKTVGDISQARTRIVTGIGIAGIVSLAFCLSISLLPLLSQMVSGTVSSNPSGKFFPVSNADWLLWYCFTLIFSFVLSPIVGIQFLRLRRGYRNNQAETAPMTGERIPGKNHSDLLLTIALILSALLLTGGYLMIGCTGGILSTDTCQKIGASFTTRPVNALAPQIQVPSTRYHNIYQKIGASITTLPLNASTYQMQIFPARYYYSYQKYWIILDPVYNKQVGDKLLVNATTNLPVGEEVRCEIKSGNEYIQLKNQSAGSTIVHVIAGENGLNNIVLSIDTAELVPDVYAHGQKGSLSQAGYSITEQAGWVNAKNQTFILLDAPVYDISLDPISDKQFGDTFTVTGRTNIPAGAEIRVTAYSLFNQSNEITIAESSLIIPDKIGRNKTMATIDTSVFPVIEYDKYRVVEEFRNYFNSNSSIYIAHSGATDFNIGTRPPAPHYISVQECRYNYLRYNTRGIGSSSSYNITIVSATNLSTGEDISWELRSISYEDVFLLNGTPIINGTAKVTKGDAAINETVVTVDLLAIGDNYEFIILEKGKNEEAFGYEICIPNYSFHP